MLSGTLDFSSPSARLNSLKRSLNSNGKSSTGIGLANAGHEPHPGMDQYLMHTATGKIYIPSSDTPKNSTSDYKTSSPSSSPSKKTSASLLYKDGAGAGTLRGHGAGGGGGGTLHHLHHSTPHHHHLSRGKADSGGEESELIYKFKDACTWKLAAILASVFFLLAIVMVILLGTGAISWTGHAPAKSAKACGDHDDLSGAQGHVAGGHGGGGDPRQSQNGSWLSGSQGPRKLPAPGSSSGGMQFPMAFLRETIL